MAILKSYLVSISIVSSLDFVINGKKFLFEKDLNFFKVFTGVKYISPFGLEDLLFTVTICLLGFFTDNFNTFFIVEFFLNGEVG